MLWQGGRNISNRIINREKNSLKTLLRVSVRVLNRLGLVIPVNGKTVSEEDEHEWTEEFEVGPVGLITKVHVAVHFKEPHP